MNKLHLGARWLFRVSGLLFMIPAAVALVYMGSIAALAMKTTDSLNADGFGLSWIVVLLVVIVMIIFIEIYARLTYSNWRYEFTEHNLKLERGIIWKKYSNIPYERVQNVDVSRGILARMLGFSTVDIQTAGASYSARGIPQSEGHIPAVGVKHAEEIRDFLMAKISHKSRGI